MSWIWFTGNRELSHGSSPRATNALSHWAVSPIQNTSRGTGLQNLWDTNSKAHICFIHWPHISWYLISVAIHLKSILERKRSSLEILTQVPFHGVCFAFQMEWEVWPAVKHRDPCHPGLWGKSQLSLCFYHMATPVHYLNPGSWCGGAEEGSCAFVQSHFFFPFGWWWLRMIQNEDTLDRAGEIEKWLRG